MYRYCRLTSDQILGEYVAALVAMDKAKNSWKEYRTSKKITSALFQEDMHKIMICEERVRQEREKSRQIHGKNDKHSVLKAKVIGIIPGITRIVKIKEKTDHSPQNNSAP